MNNKSIILGLYLVAIFIILKNWYNQGNSGMPYPTTIAAPSYLYAVLGLTADFTGSFGTVLAAGLTLGLYYATHTGKTIIKTGVQNVKPTEKPVKSPTHPGVNP